MSTSPDILHDFSALQSDVARLSQTNVELANRLMEAKRERDEARTELEMWRDGNIMHEFHRDEVEKVERERDEAREALNGDGLQITIKATSWAKLAKERDAAVLELGAIQAVVAEELALSHTPTTADEAREAIRAALAQVKLDKEAAK